MLGEETKGKRPLEYPFPTDLVPALRRYLCHYRRFAIDSRHSRGASRQAPLPTAGARLWINQYETPLTKESFHERIAERTTARFGHSLTPKLFRDCALTDIAAFDPEHARIAASLLGQRRLTDDRNLLHSRRRELRAGNLSRADYVNPGRSEKTSGEANRQCAGGSPMTSLRLRRVFDLALARVGIPLGLKAILNALNGAHARTRNAPR